MLGLHFQDLTYWKKSCKLKSKNLLKTILINETRGTLPGAPPFYTFDLTHVEKNISIGLILSLIIMSTFPKKNQLE